MSATSRLLLERGEELAAGDRSRTDALAGQGSLLMLEGVAGIGKTRVLELIVERGLDAGLGGLRARGGELERGFSYGVVRQLFEGALSKATATERRSLLSGAAATAGVALENGGDRDLADADGRESFRTIHGLYWLTANLAAARPLVIAVDDAQWADGPSLRFLVYLARRLEELPISLVVATRPDEPERERELLAQLAAAGGARLLRPGALSEVAVAELLTDELGVRVDEQFAVACHAATAGNPFYLTELISALRAERVAPTAAAAATIRDLRPETVGRAILLRLSRLPPGAGALAQAVAVLGERTDLRHAAALAGQDMDTAAAAADALASADLFTAGGQPGFVHAIVRAVLYGDIPPAERSRLHAAAARLLAAEDASADHVATHLMFVTPSGDQWVVDALRHGAQDALSRGAPGIAVPRLRRALSEPPDPHRRRALLAELGRAEMRVGDTAAAIEHCQRALDDETDPRTRAELAVVLRTALVLADRPRDAIEVLEGVLADVGDRDLELVAMLEMAIATAAAPGVDTNAMGMERAEVLRGRVARGETEDPWVIGACAIPLAVTGERTADHVGGFPARAADLWLRGDYEGTAYSPPVQAMLQALLNALMLCEQYAIADTVLERAEREARNRGWLPELLQALAFRGTSAYRQGRLADAEADTRAVLALSSEHEDWSYVLHGNTTLVLTLLERGALEEAGAALRQSGLDPLAHDGVDARWLLHARGRLLCADGQPSDGLEDLLEAGARFERARQPSPALAPWRSDAALAHLALGDRVSAIRLATEELDLARAYGAPRALGIALRGAGLVHGGGRGIELLEEAVSVLGESAAALERARALVDLGAAMRRGARRADGRKHLQAGRELAHALGAAPLVERATLELRAAGARPRALMVTGRDSLTASEARIAQMAADGMANREIAQALFVSSRTVENHLARIYQKLGIHSRNKLGSAMAASEPG